MSNNDRNIGPEDVIRESNVLTARRIEEAAPEEVRASVRPPTE